jgi:hypothetical protein
VLAYKASQRDLNIWVGESHSKPQGNYLAVNLSGFVFASDNDSATIGVVVFVTEGLGFVIQF